MAEKDIINTPIKNKQEVIDFFDYLYVDRKLSFHPDDDFADYTNLETKKPAFTKAEVPLLNKRMKEAFAVLGDDIYEVGMDRLFVHYPDMKEAAHGGDLSALPKHQFEDGGPMEEPKSIRTFKTGGSMCPVGTEIQTLIFKKAYFTKGAAIEWVKKYDFSGHEVDEKPETYHIRQQSPEKFEKDSFRTINLRTGLKAVIGCPIKK